MKQVIAIPTSNDCLCQHFGHCEKFSIYETENKKIINEKSLTPPPHEPGVFPAWLASQGATHIIAGGIGQRAIALFNQNNIEVIIGAGANSPKQLVNDYLNGKLITGKNACDH